MKRSKLVCLSLSLLVSIGLLAGCGGEKKEAGKASEMYPLYWTPSKEGTFCVIRLNLS